MLFTDITEIKTILPISVSNDFNKIKPHIAAAESTYISPLLGGEFYESLLDFYQSDYPETPTESQKAKLKLQQKVQFALIHLTYFIGFDFFNISVSDMGFTRQESEHTKGLYKYQEDNLRDYFLQNGLNELDNVLVYLENNIDYFEEFKTSTNWEELKKSFLPTVKTIENIPYNIHQSRLIFLALKPHISFAQDADIKPLLGSTIYEYIKSEMVKESPAEKVTKILPYIRKPLIYLSAAYLMEETGATLYDKGLYFKKTMDTNPNDTQKGASDPQTVAKRVANERLKASFYLEALKQFLLENIEDWEDYNNQTGSLFNRNNDNKKTFWT